MTTNSASGIGSSSLTMLGTVTTGVWNGTPVAVSYGGSGDSSFTAYSVLCGGTTSTGALQNVSNVGISGQVLTSSGASAVPTWQSVGLRKIDSITASNQAAVIFNSQFSSSYDVYLFEFINVIPVTNNVIFYSQLGTGSTPTWTTSGYNWQMDCGGAGTDYLLNNSSDTKIVLNQNGGTYGVSSSFSGINGYLYVIGTNNSANYSTGVGQTGHISATTQYSFLNNVSFFLGSGTYTSIQFYFSSGNVSSGTISMYGL